MLNTPPVCAEFAENVEAETTKAEATNEIAPPLPRLATLDIMTQAIMVSADESVTWIPPPSRSDRLLDTVQEFIVTDDAPEMYKAPPLPTTALAPVALPLLTVTEFRVTVDNDKIDKHRTVDLPSIIKPLPLITSALTLSITIVLVRVMFAARLIVTPDAIAATKLA
jgi:hypothetical protein